MKTIFWMVILLALAILIAFFIPDVGGNIILWYQNHAIEFTIFTFILGIMILFLILYILKIIFSIPFSVKRFSKKRKQNKSYDLLSDIGISYFLLDFNNSINMVNKNINNFYDKNLKNILLAFGAESAYCVNDKVNLDKFLSMLSTDKKNTLLFKDTLLTKYFLSKKEYKEAESIFNRLKKNNAKLDSVIYLGLEFLLLNNDYKGMLRDIKLLEKKKFNGDGLTNYKKQAYIGLINNSENNKALDKIVTEVPENIKDNEVIIAVARKYTNIKSFDKANNYILDNYLYMKNDELLDSLMHNTVQIDINEQKDLLSKLENLLQRYDGKNYYLLFITAQIATIVNDSIKAKEYLKQSIKLNNNISDVELLEDINVDKTEK